MQYKVRVYTGTAFRSLMSHQIGGIYNSIDEIPTDIFETFDMKANQTPLTEDIWFYSDDREDAEVFMELVRSELGLGTSEKFPVEFIRDESTIAVRCYAWTCKIYSKEDDQLWKAAKGQTYALIDDHYEPLADVKKKLTRIKNTYLRKDPTDSDYVFLKD